MGNLKSGVKVRGTSWPFELGDYVNVHSMFSGKNLQNLNVRPLRCGTE